MKKFISLFLMIAILLTSVSIVSASNEFISGDVDLDGAITMKDSAIIARYTAGWKDYKKTDGTITFPDDPSKPFKGRNPEGFAVGFDRVAITPDIDQTVVLGGGYSGSYNRLAEGKYDDNCATCIAFKDESGNIAIMVSMDYVNIYESIANNFRNVISAKTGVPFDNIFICCTHAHNGPDTHCDSILGVNSAVLKYLNETYQKVGASALRAVRDLDSSKVYYGKTKTHNLNYVRRWWAKMKDGSKAWASQATANVNQYLNNETAADETVQYLVIKRENQKDIMLYSWQCHAATTGSEAKCTADFVNGSKTKLENDLDMYTVYFQGACANINSKNLVYTLSDAYKEYNSFKSDSMQSATYKQSQYVGTKLAEFVEASYNANEYKEIATGDIITKKGEYAATMKSDAQKTENVQYYSLSFGNSFAFAFCSYEMFDSDAMDVKYGYHYIDNKLSSRENNNGGNTSDKAAYGDYSKFPCTFVIELTNASHGYIPSDLAWDHGLYEVNETRYVQGTGHALALKMIEMLNQSYDEASN